MRPGSRNTVPFHVCFKIGQLETQRASDTERRQLAALHEWKILP
jgi:hypothetical protein